MISELYLLVDKNENLVHSFSGMTPFMLLLVSQNCWWGIGVCTQSSIPVSRDTRRSHYGIARWNIISTA